MSISRRSILLGTAAGMATAATVGPVAFKVAETKAALAGDDSALIAAYEAFEAVRTEHKATHDRIDEADRLADARAGAQPDFDGRHYYELDDAERAVWDTWSRRHTRIKNDLLADIAADVPDSNSRWLEDRLIDHTYSRCADAYDAVAAIRPRTIAGMLCQIEAWHRQADDLCSDDPLPEVASDDRRYLDGDLVVLRLYHDLRALTGRAT